MILFFDTETTGIPAYSLAPDDECQPHIVQLAAIMTEDDGTERGSFNLIVDPPIDIPEQASDVHGITKEITSRSGVTPVAAIALFGLFASRCDRIVAHNLKFDLALIETARLRCKRSIILPFYRICTMDLATPILNLAPTDRMVKAGFNKPKPPKLEECIRHFYDEDLNGAHDALVDVRACARVYFELVSMGAVQ